MGQFHLLSDYGSVGALQKPERESASVGHSVDLKKHMNSATLMIPPFTPEMTSSVPPW